MNKAKGETFWIGYSDLITSLFFVMLVFFVISVAVLSQSANDGVRLREQTDSLNVKIVNQQEHIKRLEESDSTLQKGIDSLKTRNGTLEETVSSLKGEIMASRKELDKIRELNKSIEKIDSRYFKYDENFKRHTLKDITVSFRTRSANINDIPKSDREKLLNAGHAIRDFMGRAKNEIPEAKYMLIVEGQSSRDSYKKNYELSYARALALVKMWSKSKVDIEKYENCEIIISGSGCESKFRETPDNNRNKKNQRFVIHIVPKPGVIE